MSDQDKLFSFYTSFENCPIYLFANLRYLAQTSKFKFM